MSVEIILRKKLTASEVQKGFVRVPNNTVKQFPRGSFKVMIGSTELTKKVDKYNRIYFGLEGLAKAGDEIVFHKKPDGSYAVQVESRGESPQQSPAPT